MNDYKGKILHTSWGYDMTFNDFCKVIETSPTGKTVKCRMLSKRTNGLEWGPDGSGRASAGDEMTGPEFRLRIRRYGDSVYFVGSYPFCGNTSKRKGHFSIVEKTESFYENHWD